MNFGLLELSGLSVVLRARVFLDEKEEDSDDCMRESMR